MLSEPTVSPAIGIFWSYVQQQYHLSSRNSLSSNNAGLVEGGVENWSSEHRPTQKGCSNGDCRAHYTFQQLTLSTEIHEHGGMHAIPDKQKDSSHNELLHVCKTNTFFVLVMCQSQQIQHKLLSSIITATVLHELALQ